MMTREIIQSAEEHKSVTEIIEFVEHLELYDIVVRKKKKAGKRISSDKHLTEEGIKL